jgi:hypothetical protein
MCARNATRFSGLASPSIRAIMEAGMRWSIVALIAAAALAAPASSAVAPVLRATSFSPLAIRGTGFKPGEPVKVTVLPQRAVASVRADMAGVVVARFDGVVVGRCGSVAVRAQGAHGDVALLKRPPLPACSTG